MFQRVGAGQRELVLHEGDFIARAKRLSVFLQALAKLAIRPSIRGSHRQLRQLLQGTYAR
ncbi:hypothetical protein GCM10027046_29380 [Uliginosibacterium flavum]